MKYFLTEHAHSASKATLHTFSTYEQALKKFKQICKANDHELSGACQMPENTYMSKVDICFYAH